MLPSLGQRAALADRPHCATVQFMSTPSEGDHRLSDAPAGADSTNSDPGSTGPDSGISPDAPTTQSQPYPPPPPPPASSAGDPGQLGNQQLPGWGSQPSGGQHWDPGAGQGQQYADPSQPYSDSAQQYGDSSQPYDPSQQQGAGQAWGGQPNYAAYQGYGYQYPYGYPPKTDDKAVWALVSSIAGWVLCPVVLHIVGWVLANQSLRQIRASGGALQGEGMAQAARIVSIVGLALFGIAILLCIAFLVLAMIGLIAGASSGDLYYT